MEKHGVRTVRLHHMFLRAPDSVIDDLATFLMRSNRHANARLDRYIEDNDDKIRKGIDRNTTLRTEGEHYDLQSIYNYLNRQYFEDALDLRITWGKAPNKARRHSIRMGTYSQDEQLIRIHPSLDASWVPSFVVELVIYHEMLHAVVPPILRGRQKIFHTPEFRRREAAHPDYQKAVAWERANLYRLLRT